MIVLNSKSSSVEVSYGKFTWGLINALFCYCVVGNIRDFTDTLILARKEAEEDTDEPDVQTLTDTHIIQILLNLFFGKVIILMLMEKTSPELKASRMQKV